MSGFELSTAFASGPSLVESARQSPHREIARTKTKGGTSARRVVDK